MVDSLFAKIGEYLDCFLQPLAQNCPVYLKDSKNLMELLKGIEVDNDSILASIDANSLYTIIQQQHALVAVKWALDSTNFSTGPGFGHKPQFLLARERVL